MWNHILWWHVQLVKCYIKQDWGCYRSNVREWKRPSLVFVIEPVWNHNSCVCCIEGKKWMHRIKKSVSGDLTMIRPLIPLSPNVLSAWIACKIIRVFASSCVQYNSWQSETPSLQIFLAMIRSTRKIRNFPGWHLKRW